LSSLRAQFTQIKHSSLLLEAARSDGVFSFRAPDRVRWDFSQPTAMVVLFSGNVMTTFHPIQGRAERVKLSRKHRRFVRVLAGTQPLDDLASQFRITLSDAGSPEPYRLTLSPTHSVIQKKLSLVVLEVDRELLLPVVVEYHEVDGDTTRYEFRSMELNPELDDSHFELELGGDVIVETIDVSSGIG
jgi:outer membrane lipoprotein carrier protein